MIKKILAIIAALVFLAFIGKVDGGVGADYHPRKEYATVEVVITLEDGNTFIAERYESEVTFNDHFSEDMTCWEATRW